MRTVRNILDNKQKGDNITSPDTLVIDALGIMSRVNLSYLIVMEGNEFRGLFSERDYSRNLLLKGRSSSSTPVKDVMTSDLPSVSVTDSVEKCMKEMISNKTRYLIALGRDAGFEGVITIHDLLREVISNKEGVFDSVAHELLDHDETGHVY